jgi:hypothetical protein
MIVVIVQCSVSHGTLYNILYVHVYVENNGCLYRKTQGTNLAAVDRLFERFVESGVMVVVKVRQDVGGTAWDYPIAKGIHCEASI